MHDIPKPTDRQPPALAAALAYAERGWRVLPLHSVKSNRCTCRGQVAGCNAGKHPRIKGGHAAATTNRDKIEQWWPNWPDANVGILTGATSNLVVIDVDPRHGGEDSINDLFNRFGQPPRGPLVKTGGNGWHYYFRHPGGTITSKPGIMPGIDIRGKSVYVVAPPSIHISGERYVWQTEPETCSPPPLPEPWLEWLTQSGCYTSGASGPSHTSNASNPSNASRASNPTERIEVGGGEGEFGLLEGHIARCLQATIPGHIGQRRARLFRFLVLLKRHPELKGQEVQAIRPCVKLWHEKALPAIGSKPFTETWDDAVGAWDRADDRKWLPARLLADALDGPLPNVIQTMDYADDPVTVKLVLLCRALQEYHEKDPFYLSCHVAGETVGCNAMTALRRLNMMRADGVIELVTKGSRKDRAASEYRYLADRGGQSTDPGI